MAVGYDILSSFNTGGANPVVINMDIANVANRCLVVLVELDSSANSVSSISGAGATWGGSAFGSINCSNGSRLECWQGIGPTNGNQNVTVTLNTTANGVVQTYSMNGVDQTTPLSGFVSKNSSADPVDESLSVTSGDAGVAIACGSADFGASGGSGDDNTTNDYHDAPAGVWVAAAHVLASGSTIKIGFANAGANNCGIAAVVVKQVGGGAGNTNITPTVGSLSDTGTQSVLNKGIFTRSMIQGT